MLKMPLDGDVATSERTMKMNRKNYGRCVFSVICLIETVLLVGV